jgi:regulator of sigma E protease
MITSLLAFLIVFSAVVLVHELGHFLLARRAGVKVHEFSVGFPFSPRICTLFRHKETEFTLRLLPFGGFVSFSREGDEEATGFFAAPLPARGLILAAGSGFNILFAFLLFIPVLVLGRHLSFFEAVLGSARTVWEIASGTVLSLMQLLSGTGGTEGLSGPVGIAAMAGRAAHRGVLNLCYFTGVLSMSLGIMNLLPLPALDGGHLLMLFIEGLRKRPISARVRQAVSLAGFLLFLVLSLLVTYTDIVALMT